MPLRRYRRPYRQLNDFERGRIVGMREAGWSYRAIGRHLQRTDTAVQRCWQQWLRQGNCRRNEGSGRPRSTNARQDRMIVRQARTAPTVSLSTIQRTTASSIPPVVPSTISRRLAKAGLRSQRPLRRLPLTPQHRRSRLEWCRSRSSWLPSDWHRIVFSDESRFTLAADDHRLRVWRGRGQRSQSAFVLQRHTAITPGVMVWGAISYDSRSSLVILRTSLTAQRYVDTILRPVALPFMARHPGASFQQDNARPHTAHISLDCLRAVDTLPWPARSPDLSPIEHVWDMVGRQIRAPQNIADLEQQLMNAWQNVSQDDIRNLYHSLARRIQACIAARGGSTNY